MPTPIYIPDNCQKYTGRLLTEAEKDDLRKLALPTIYDLVTEDGGGLLVFPPNLDVYGDKIGKQHIVQFWNDRLQTGNIIGFIGINNTRLHIYSRFSEHNEHGNDYFLYYMLQKVFSVNLFDLKYSSDRENVFDFLIYLFPYYLKKAVRQGLYKAYRHYKYNDANVRGIIDVNRHIRLNVPFTGHIAYSTREYSPDNNITELVRHTIEYIDKHPLGREILTNDKETLKAVEQIRMATPSYRTKDLRLIISKNTRPMRHPYYTEYRPLQRICLQILKHDEIKYGRKQDDIYGILFDGAWLWEEYLNTVLSQKGFNHPRNKTREGGVPVFKGSALRFYPDFWNDNVVLDAKYKDYGDGSVQSKDYQQIIAYMHLLRATLGGLIVPCKQSFTKREQELFGHGGKIKIFGLKVGSSDQYSDFKQQMQDSENSLTDEIAKFK